MYIYVSNCGFKYIQWFFFRILIYKTIWSIKVVDLASSACLNNNKTEYFDCSVNKSHCDALNSHLGKFH